MTYLLYLFNVVCASGQVACGKQYGKNGGSSVAFNLNKAIIGTVLFLVVGVADGFSFHLSTLLFGAGYGISLCISMHTGFKALACGPMALTSVIASFSLILSFFAGVFFWNEPITVFGISGIFLLLASIILINTKKESGFSVKWLA